MTFDIPSEFEPLIRNAIETGAFATTEDALAHALALLAKEQGVALGKGPTEHGKNESHESWAKRLRSFAASQKPTGRDVDDRRESIYPDRA